MDIIIDIHSIVSGITSSRAKPPPRTCSDTPATVNRGFKKKKKKKKKERKRKSENTKKRKKEILK